MLDNTLNVFFSWQSDLAGRDNKYLIEEAIKEATKFLKGTVSIIPDRDTKGTTGSPNIEEVIFKKITNCDLFVADITFVTTYKNKDGKEKKTPNPNVLIELGYAVRVLGWENIICFFNEEYGNVNDLPFDLNHHRVTGYSVKNSSKSVVKQDMKNIIASTVMNMLENGVRPKEGYASHIIGSYDWESKEVKKVLIPHKINDSKIVNNIFEQMRMIIRKKIEEINNISLPLALRIDTEKEKEDNASLVVPNINLDLYKYKAADIKQHDKDYIKRFADELDVKLKEDFFYFDDLEVSINSYPMLGGSYRGSAIAKKKYDDIKNLILNINDYDMCSAYLHTFDGMLFFPLAIWNNTEVTDIDVNIAIVVDDKTAEVVVPDDNLIDEVVKDLAGDIYESGMIKKLFCMTDTIDIFDGSDPTFSPVISKQLYANTTIDPFGYLNEPSYDIDDYVSEIKKYIANPIKGSRNEFDFHISKLQSNEKNWLGKGVLLKPIGNEIRIRYRIRSDSTKGNLHGELKYIVEREAIRDNK